MKKFLILFLLINLAFCDEFNVDAILQDAQKNEQTTEIKLDKFTKDASTSYKKLQKEYYDKYEYVPPSKDKASVEKAGFCYSYTLRNEGDKNFCLAFAKHDKSFCHSYHLTTRQKNICLGLCYDYTLSDADKNYCLALKNNNINYCYSLKGDYQTMCLGRFNKSNCYSLTNEGKRNMCLGISLN